MASFIVVKSDYVPRENDSRFYSLVTQNLCQADFKEMITPKWDGFAQHFADKKSPFIRDHPAGQFVLPTLLCKAGFNAEYSLLSLNIFYKLLIYSLLTLIVIKITGNPAATWSLLLIQLAPISLSYLLRSNHEQPLLLAHLVALLGFLFAAKVWRLGLPILGILLAISIKGMIALPLIVTVITCYLLERESWRLKLINVGALLASIAAFLGLYEYLFRLVSGVHFWLSYLEIQILGRSVDESAPIYLNLIKGSFYYSVRLITYTAPIFLVLLFVAFRKRGLKLDVFKRERSALIFTCLYVIFSVGFFSLSHRTASRYIYVSYYFFILLMLTLIFSNSASGRFKKALIVYSAAMLVMLQVGVKTYLERDNKEKYDIPYSTVEERDLLKGAR